MSAPSLDRFLGGMPLEYCAIEGLMVHGTWRAGALVVTDAKTGKPIKDPVPMSKVEAEDHYRRIVATKRVA